MAALALRSVCFFLGERDLRLHYLGGWRTGVDSRLKREICPTAGNQTLGGQTVSSHSTDRATAAHLSCLCVAKYALCVNFVHSTVTLHDVKYCAWFVLSLCSDTV